MINFTIEYNETTSIPDLEVNYTLKTIFDVINVSFQVVVMVSMGCVITIQEIISHIKKPIAVGIALLSQFVVLPLTTFGIISLLEMSPPVALSILIMGCCPGGSSSNLFTYLSDGDVSLSIMLTTTSTILSVGLLPLNLWIYAHKWTADTIKVPYITIAITTAVIVIPLAIGMVIRKRHPKVARIIANIGSVCGMLFIIVNGVLQNFVFPDSYNQSWKGWIAAASILIIGFSFGFLFALLFRQSVRICRTIGIETGMQSIGLALAIVIISFPVELQRVMTPFPMFYGIILFVVGLILAGVIQIRERFFKNKRERDDNYRFRGSNFTGQSMHRIVRGPTRL